MKADPKTSEPKRRNIVKGYWPALLAVALLVLSFVLLSFSLARHIKKDSLNSETTEKNATAPLVTTDRTADFLTPAFDSSKKEQDASVPTKSETSKEADAKMPSTVQASDETPDASAKAPEEKRPEWLSETPNRSYPMEAKKPARKFQGSAPVVKLKNRIPKSLALAQAQQEKDDLAAQTDAMVTEAEQAKFDQNQGFIEKAIKDLPLASVQAHDPLNPDIPGPKQGEVWVRLQPEYARKSGELMGQVAELYHQETQDFDPVTVVLWIGGRPIAKNTFEYMATSPQ